MLGCRKQATRDALLDRPAEFVGASGSLLLISSDNIVLVLSHSTQNSLSSKSRMFQD